MTEEENKNEPETLNVRWLSSCQTFAIIGEVVATKDSELFKYQQAMSNEDGEEREIVAMNFQPMVGAVASATALVFS